MDTAGKVVFLDEFALEVFDLDFDFVVGFEILSVGNVGKELDWDGEEVVDVFEGIGWGGGKNERGCFLGVVDVVLDVPKDEDADDVVEEP